MPVVYILSLTALAQQVEGVAWRLRGPQNLKILMILTLREAFCSASALGFQNQFEMEI